MQFWRLDSPEYESDYADTFINGSLAHPFGLPGVECERCGSTWGGCDILPYELPPEFQTFKELKARWPIPGHAHANLRARVLAALQAAGAPITELHAGASFQPAYLDVPSRPEADFLWNSLGSVVVSSRICDALTEAAIKGGVLVPVVARKIGRRKAKLPPPLPSTGEPEDLITETKRLLDPSKLPPYYELVITGESKNPPGTEPQSICDLCGRATYNMDTRKLVMQPDMWRGDDIFLLATTLWIIVTDQLKTLLEGLRPTNIRFIPLARAV